MILAKWGGSLLTNKGRGARPRFQKATARRLAREWRQGVGDKPGILVHGAGSFGHPAALRWGVGQRRLKGQDLRNAFLEIRDGVDELQRAVVGVLRAIHLPAVAVPVGVLVQKAGATTRLNPEPLRRLIRQGFLPVTGGDVVSDARRGLRILSGDEILAGLARQMRPRRVVFATDVDGVWLGDWLAMELPRDAAMAALNRMRRGSDSTGGMKGKLEAVVQVQAAGAEAWFVNGGRPGSFARALAGRPLFGTRFPPARGRGRRV